MPKIKNKQHTMRKAASRRKEAAKYKDGLGQVRKAVRDGYQRTESTALAA